MLEEIRCSKFIKIFSYLRSTTDMQYASSIFFLGFREFFFFLFCHLCIVESVLLYCYHVSLGQSTQIRIVWIGLRRINFKVLSKRTCSRSCLSWLSCREFTLFFCCCLGRLLFLSCFAFKWTIRAQIAAMTIEMGYHQVILKGLAMVYVSDVRHWTHWSHSGHLDRGLFCVPLLPTGFSSMDTATHLPTISSVC